MTPSVETVSYEEKLKDPRGHFSVPEAILDNAELSRDQKLELLRQWEEDENALIRAGSESPMTDGEEPMLGRVEDAIQRLEGSGP